MSTGRWKVIKNYWWRVCTDKGEVCCDWHMSTCPPERWLSKTALSQIKSGKLYIDYDDELSCSECESNGWHLGKHARFCPMCGALMNEEV